MFEYKIDAIAKKMLSFEKYTMFRYKHGIFRKWTRQAKYYAPYLLKNKKNNHKYLVFRNSITSGAHYFSFLKQYIFAAEWAEENGYIPIADIEREEDFYNCALGKNNQFEFCFVNKLPINKVSGEENAFVYALNSTICSEQVSHRLNPLSNKADIVLCENDNWKEYYSNIGAYIEKWLPLNEDFQHFLEKEVYNFLPNCKCLGVSIREVFHMDFQDEIINKRALNQLAAHPKTVSIGESVRIIKSKMDEWGYEKLILATQCQDTVDLFIKEFGDRVIYINRNRKKRADMIEAWNATGTELGDDEKQAENDIERVRAYVGETLLLAKCDSFIATKSGGAIMSMAFNSGKYESAYFFETINDANIYQ